MKIRYLLVGVLCILIAISLTVVVMRGAQAAPVEPVCPVTPTALTVDISPPGPAATPCPDIEVMTILRDTEVRVCPSFVDPDCYVMSIFHAGTWTKVYGEPVEAEGVVWRSVSPIMDLWIVEE